MSDVLFQDDDSMLERFSCECLDSGHVLDLFIDGLGNNNPLVMLSFNVRKQSLWARTKHAWKMIVGWECCLDEFVLRQEDIGQLAVSLAEVLVREKNRQEDSE